MKQRQWGYRILRGIAVILLGVLVGCDRKPSTANAGEAENQPKPVQKQTNVEVLQLSPQTFMTQSTYIGHLLPKKRVRVKTELEGIVEAVHFSEAGNVQEDQVLVQISTKQQTLSYQQAQSNFKLAESNLKRDKSLAKKNLITPAQLEQTQNQREVAFYALEQAKLNLEKATIQAPFAGVVKSKNVEVGDFVNKGQLIAEVLEIQQLKALVHVPETDLPFIETGQSMQVSFDTVEGIFPGQVISIGWEADPQSHSFPIEVMIDNPQQQLRAGMLARVQVQTQQHHDQIMIPRHALLERASGPMVYVIEESMAQARPIIMGESVGNQVQVTAGLKSGDALVVGGQNQLQAGSTVVVQANQHQSMQKGGAHASE